MNKSTFNFLHHNKADRNDEITTRSFHLEVEYFEGTREALFYLFDNVGEIAFIVLPLCAYIRTYLHGVTKERFRLK